ncbi:unnamed protein product [Prorocentrum cordatum]|uniref:Poly [ADP-ribose] polymerase n=1 Tax=Prorocentrum cordatum TaxID=2364126 RepID=A0ABN9VYX7_9DINO|nr:unnamed protein product [Polarella glacialis]
MVESLACPRCTRHVEGRACALCQESRVPPGDGSREGCHAERPEIPAERDHPKDEYAGPCGGPDDAEADLLVVLLCRVVGGRVHYTDQDTPDPHFLSKSVVHGSYDSVLGDREKLKGTFREFIVYNNDQAYPEYIVMYRRRYIDPAPDPKKAPPTPVTTTSTISSATIAASHRATTSTPRSLASAGGGAKVAI